MKARSVALATVLLVGGCLSEPALVRQTRKVRLIEAIRDALLQGVDAEKSAVLATTDEESISLAREAQEFTATINRLLVELRTSIMKDQRRAEVENLNAFDAAWAETMRIDERLLALAVRNSNLKATRLLAGAGATALDSFVETISEMSRGAAGVDTVRTLLATSIAALRIQPLLAAHIPEAEDAIMTQLEMRMQTLSADVNRHLAALSGDEHIAAAQLAAATKTWKEYQQILADVVRLSRENSNVISFDVSIHEKRYATKECLTALSALLKEIEPGPAATR